jgi:transcriptional regulator with PAS, ATPase and Fis domain
MVFYKRFEESLNDEIFDNTAGLIQIKTKNELIHCSCVHHELVQEVFQTGMKASIDNTVFYFPVKIGFSVEAVLLLTPKDNREDEFSEQIGYLEKMARVGCNWVGISIENERRQKELEITKMELSTLFSTIAQPFCVVSQDGVIQELNDHLALMVQKQRSILIGEKISYILTSDSWETIKQRTWKEERTLQLRNSPAVKTMATIQPIQFDKKTESYLIYFKTEMGTQRKKEHKKRQLYSFAEIKGVSEVLQITKNAAERVSKSDATIMLRGESGTGKELFAQSIHNESERRKRPFITINCAAIPENLLESELFGYEKGAFTGAAKDKPGRFELAHTGTIFLDEIGDMSLYLQAKLLRVIQEKTIERVGANKSQEIDVRIITATHQNLENLVKVGKFREDLYYRISVIPIFIPPLRERKEDLPLLIEHYMSEFSQEMGRSPKKLSKEVYHTFMEYTWPGNIRELQNVVRHFVELEIGDTVTLQSLPSSFSQRIENVQLKAESSVARSTGKINKDEILRLLDRYGWNTEGKKKSAQELGISLPTLYRWIKKLKV